MGFTTGFLGGLTATYAVLYLSIHLHRTNRQHQSLLLTQQKALLTSLLDPVPPQFDSPAYEVRKAGLTEELKDRWNRELGNVVRNLQEKDWEQVRIKWENRANNLWDNVRGTEAAQNVESTLKEGAKNVESTIKDGVKNAESTLRDGVKNVKNVGNTVKENVLGSGSGAVDAAKEDVKKAVGGKRLLEL